MVNRYDNQKQNIYRSIKLKWKKEVKRIFKRYNNMYLLIVFKPDVMSPWRDTSINVFYDSFEKDFKDND